MHNVYVTNNYQTKKKKKNQDENKIFCLQNRAFTAFLRRKKKVYHLEPFQRMHHDFYLKRTQ